MGNNRPDYITIFKDIIIKKCPERLHEFDYYFNKQNISSMDIVELNDRIFGLKDKGSTHLNQKHKSYDRETIVYILNYQQEEKLNNTQLANYFNLSRNTISKWRKLYKIYSL